MENFYSFFLTLYYAYTSIKLPPSYQAFINQRFDFIYRKQSFILTGDEAYNRLVEVFPDFLIRINGRNVRNFIKFDVTNLNDFMFNSLCLQPYSIARELPVAYVSLLRKVIFKLSSSSNYIHYDIFTGQYIKYTGAQVNADHNLNNLFVIETTFEDVNDPRLNRNVIGI